MVARRFRSLSTADPDQPIRRTPNALWKAVMQPDPAAVQTHGSWGIRSAKRYYACFHIHRRSNRRPPVELNARGSRSTIALRRARRPAWDQPATLQSGEACGAPPLAIPRASCLLFRRSRDAFHVYVTYRQYSYRPFHEIFLAHFQCHCGSVPWTGVESDHRPCFRTTPHHLAIIV